MSALTIYGIVAYPVTPFTADGSLDLPRLAQLVDRLVDSNAHAIAPLGSAGEGAYLSNHEWEQAAETSLQAVAGRVPTIVGIADLTTAGAVRRARYAERHGADAVMLLPLSYWKLSEPEIVRHFGTVAASIGIPVMAYNNPATAGIDLPPELLVGLTERSENVTMIKESSGDIARLRRIHELTGGEVPFFNGSNPLALQAFAAGAAGWCTAAACLIPAQCISLWELARAERLSEAGDLLDEILPLLRFILRHGGLPATIKAGLALDGFPVGDPRLPLLPLGDLESAELSTHIARARGELAAPS